MTENGFSYMKRTLRRTFERFWDSPLTADLKEKFSNQANSKRLVTMLDTDDSKKLSEMAHQVGLDTGPFVLNLLTDTLQTQGQEAENKIAMWGLLTRREREVAALACKGMTNPEIGAVLFISEETAKKHMSSILSKFGVKGRGVLKWMLESWNFENPEEPWKIEPHV